MCGDLILIRLLYNVTVQILYRVNNIYHKIESLNKYYERGNIYGAINNSVYTKTYLKHYDWQQSEVKCDNENMILLYSKTKYTTN